MPLDGYVDTSVAQRFYQVCVVQENTDSFERPTRTAFRSTGIRHLSWTVYGKYKCPNGYKWPCSLKSSSWPSRISAKRTYWKSMQDILLSSPCGATAESQPRTRTRDSRRSSYACSLPDHCKYRTRGSECSSPPMPHVRIRLEMKPLPPL